MQLDKLVTGLDVPNDIYVVIEIPANGPGIKLELDKDSGALLVDRFMATPMYYPCNYGFVPHTLSQDGDPLDALVISPIPLISGVVARCRPIGFLAAEDDAGPDAKLLCVPMPKLTSVYDDVHEYRDLSPLMLQQIEHFFSHYQDLEPGKWMKLLGWRDAAAAKQEILDSVARYRGATPQPNF